MTNSGDFQFGFWFYLQPSDFGQPQTNAKTWGREFVLFCAVLAAGSAALCLQDVPSATSSGRHGWVRRPYLDKIWAYHTQTSEKCRKFRGKLWGKGCLTSIHLNDKGLSQSKQRSGSHSFNAKHQRLKDVIISAPKKEWCLQTRRGWGWQPHMENPNRKGLGEEHSMSNQLRTGSRHAWLCSNTKPCRKARIYLQTQVWASSWLCTYIICIGICALCAYLFS